MGVQDIRLPPKWIELNLTKRECSVFIATAEDEVMCQCGRKKIDHGETVRQSHGREIWNPAMHTETFPTDAYGTILFEGEHHPNKAHYVRLSYDTHPELVIQLMTLVWGLKMPKLIISIRGGDTNFELPPRLGKILQSGLTKAAKSTSAWIFTTGLNRGVSKHIGNTLVMGYKRGRMVSVGIAPWGLIEHRAELIGKNRDKIYNPLEHAASNLVLLNSRHSNFLLVDNGSVGKVGGDSYFRRRLEKCIASYPTSPHRGCDTPIVVIVIEGGFYTLRTIGDCLYDDPPVPVVIFAGTGRTADLLSMAIKRTTDTHSDIESLREEIYNWMRRLYHVTLGQCALLFSELKRIMARRNLVTVYFPYTSNDEDFDAVILKSIFRSQHWSPLQQLSLALVWDRVDIAANEVFVYGREWSKDHLEHAMMEALVCNRLEFVHLLLEHGLNMQTFLTATRLESLYSAERTHSNLMKTLLYELAKIRASYSRVQGAQTAYERSLTLHDVGLALSHMMGNVYKSNYIHINTKPMNNKNAFGLAMEDVPSPTFAQPFDDLFVWAVLTQRHEMAQLLWRHGQGALAKALVAVKLNKYLAVELSSSEKAQANLAEEFQNYATVWENLSLELLDTCFRADSKQARQLLTMELEHWSNQTCLTLAVMANHRMLMGHACCQMLLADLWMGALNIRSHATWKVVFGIFFPPLVFCLEYKSTEELKLLPHQEKQDQNQGAAAAPLVDNTHKDAEPMLFDYDSSIMSFGRNKSSSFLELGRNTPVENDHHKTASSEKKTDLSQVAQKLIKSKTRHHHHRHRKYVEGQEGDNVAVNIHHPDVMEHPVFPSFRDMHLHEDLRPQKPLPKQEKVGQSSFVTNRQILSPLSKFYEFQRAPVTNFYRHSLAYVVFVCCLAYVILVPQEPSRPGRVEMYVIAYLVTLGCDTLREFCNIDAINMVQKWVEFRTNVWQLADFSVITVFLVGVGLRFTGDHRVGFLLYKVTSIYWNLRLYKYMGVHRFVGPKIVMMSRMLKHMSYFAMIILVVIISFGIARESIRFPDQIPTWRNIAEAFLEPYVMMFGEVDTDALSPQCGESGQPNCPVGYWIIPFTWAIYMMVANILIVNVLIAVFNGIYSEVDAIALELWMFQRFTFVMEFEQKPLLPPPFIVICHTFYILRWLWDKFLLCMCERTLEVKGVDFEDGPRIIMGDDHSLKTFLSPAEANQIFDFEEDNLDTINPTGDLTRYMIGESAAPMLSDNNGPLVPAPESNRLDNRGLQQLRTNFREMYAEMESQREKLDKLITYWETSCEMKALNSDRAVDENSPPETTELGKPDTVSQTTSTHAADTKGQKEN